MKPQLININLDGESTIRVKKIEHSNLDTPYHFHNLCELVWIETGFGKRIIGDHVDNFGQNDLILMGPNLPHIWQNDKFNNKDQQNLVNSTVIYFQPDFLLHLSNEPELTLLLERLLERSNRGLLYSGVNKAKIIEGILRVASNEGMKKIISFLQLIDILSQSEDYEELASVSYKNINDAKDTDRINRVYRYVMQNFQQQISLEDVADLCNMTPNAFCRYFRSRTQKSFIHFLNELRIGHASRLLQNESMSIAEIAYDCGYNSIANFNKFFKKINKITPTEYRQKAKKTRSL